MSSTITDRGSAITLTDAEREALKDHAVHRLHGYDNVADLVGDAATMRTLAAEVTRAARLTEAADAGLIAPEAIETAAAGIDESIADARVDVAGTTRFRDLWRAGETGWGWPELSAEENEANHADEIADAQARLDAVESLATKLGVK